MERRKKETNENLFILMTLAILIGICLFGVYKLYFEKGLINIDENNPPVTSTEIEQEQQENAEKVYVDVFFIGHNKAEEEVYKAVRREYDENVDGTKIEFAIKSLILGPMSKEINRGVYSEIPRGTRVISIKEYPDKVIIDLTADFEQGGAESLYKRVYQLIKTAKLNTSKPVYLYINGQKAEVLGGDGLMITQPLSENSLDG
ncbi:GerMN domain-containing protein [bacterium]|nr:GerMN domain-containing protein [bacterium]